MSADFYPIGSTRLKKAPSESIVYTECLKKFTITTYSEKDGEGNQLCTKYSKELRLKRSLNKNRQALVTMLKGIYDLRYAILVTGTFKLQPLVKEPNTYKQVIRTP